MIETQSRKHVEERIRAGVLEQGTVDLLNDSGVGERMRREGLVHHGIELRFNRRGHRIDLHELTGGRAITVYGQHEVVKDLIDARLQAGGQIFFEVGAGRDSTDFDGESPRIAFQHAGEALRDRLRLHRRLRWLPRHLPPVDSRTACCASTRRSTRSAGSGILAQAAPASRELIYANHERGFALLSMRTPQISRVYLQCRPDEDLARWPDDRIWEELQRRFETATASA